MKRTYRFLYAVCIIVAVTLPLPARAEKAPPSKTFSARGATHVPSVAIWQDRGDVGKLNLLYGPGGKAHQPAGKFTFEKEDANGTSPKFEIVDEQGVHWKVKLGEEAKSETAAARLLWAAGYFVDEDYYLSEFRVEKMLKLKRGRQFVSSDGVIHGARLERKVKGQKKAGNWSWFHNPLAGTKEMDGLRVMMALMNNWDLKEINNAIYEESNSEPRYVVADLGATFGRTGNPLVRSKSNMRDYRGTKFIQKVSPEHVDFHLSSRPFFLAVFDVPNYITRTRMQGVVKHIPRSHALWLGNLLGHLSAEQVRDCFRSAGYSSVEVEEFTKVVEGRISDLRRL